MKHVVSGNSVSRISPAAARFAIGSSVAALVFLGALHVLSPEFDPAWRMVSEYANGGNGWMLSLMFGCWGLSSFAAAYAIRSELQTMPAKVGAGLLVVAGVGEAMAAVFDLNHVVLHNLAGVLGIGGLPIAAMVISVSLGRTQRWSQSKQALLLTANLTWVTVVLLAGAFALMVGTFMATGLPTPAQAPKVLPAGVIGLVGWANRLLVVSYCLWVIAVAWEALKLDGRLAVGRQIEPIPVPVGNEV